MQNIRSVHQRIAGVRKRVLKSAWMKADAYVAGQVARDLGQELDERLNDTRSQNILLSPACAGYLPFYLVSGR